LAREADLAFVLRHSRARHLNDGASEVCGIVRPEIADEPLPADLRVRNDDAAPIVSVQFGDGVIHRFSLQYDIAIAPSQASLQFLHIRACNRYYFPNQGWFGPDEGSIARFQASPVCFLTL
jgi:hypothetical protein